MYGLIWRALPGPTWFRVVEAAVLIGAVVFVLFEWGYPWFADTFLEIDPGMG